MPKTFLTGSRLFEDVFQASEMIHDLFVSGYASGVHIYTLNREVAPTSILKKLGELFALHFMKLSRFSEGQK